MPTDQSKVAYVKRDIVRILRDINSIVVSLDRIGSVSASIEPEEHDKMLADFVRTWEVFHKLAEARSVLSQAFSQELGDDEMDELERAMEGVPYWSLTSRYPPL